MLFQDNDESAVNIIILQMIYELHLSPWEIKNFSLLNRSLIFSNAFKSGLNPLVLRLSVNHLSSEHTTQDSLCYGQRNTRNPYTELQILSGLLLSTIYMENLEKKKKKGFSVNYYESDGINL